MDKDIIIIGGGPGGYVAAIRAAQLGAKVCLIEKDKLGGTCLNRGCIPTKTLYRNAEILNTLKNIDTYGIKVDSYSVDIDAVHERKQKVVDQLVGGIEQLLKANGVETIKGEASLKSKNAVEIRTEQGEIRELSAENIIIAAGSSPAVLPIEGADLPGVFTSEDMLNFKEIPEELAIIGGGVIGMEMAGIFNALGSKITVLEFLPNILAQVDTDFTKRLAPSLKKKGIAVYTSTKVTKIQKEGDKLLVFAEGKKGEIKVTADKVLMSTGRIPSLKGLNLEEAGVEFDRKGIKTDKNYETNIKGIYAIGDVNGKVMLAHAASHQGIQVVEKIMGKRDEIEDNLIPGCIFIFPEIAYAGLTEDEAKAQGLDCKVSKFMFGANGKALALGEPEGMVKVLSLKADDRLIGVHIMGPHASDLIHEGVLAVSKGMKSTEIGSIIHAHPTLSEAFSEAVLGLTGEAIHMAPAKKK